MSTSIPADDAIAGNVPKVKDSKDLSTETLQCDRHSLENNLPENTDEKQDNSMVTGVDNNNKDQRPEASDEPIDPKTLDWDGPDDMANPHNWPTWKKWYSTMTIAFLCLVVTMGSSLYVSGVPEIVLRYHVSRTLALAGLTFYLLGLSTVIGAPLSEVFGRKPIYMVSLPISMLFTMGVGLSNGHMRIILPLRFLSGAFASPALSVGSGTIMDIFDMDEVSVAMTFFCLAPFLGPVISPIMASFATEKQGWRWSEWIQIIAGGLILPFIAIMPETHKGVILRRRAKKRNMNLKKFTKEDQKAFLKITMTITIFRPLKMLVVEPIVLVFSIYVAFIFAVLFGFFEAYPVIYEGIYHMNGGVASLPFLGIGIGLWLGSLFYIFLDRKYLVPKAPEGTPDLQNPESKRTKPFRGYRDPKTGELLPVVPERFLLACKFGSIALPVALFWQAWTARPNVHWMAPIAAGVPFGFGLILIFFSVIMYFSMCFPPLFVASCIAANSLLRYVTSSVFPLFTIQMYTNLTVKWASTLFALICVVMVPIPWIFERWGAHLRRRSMFGYAALIKQQTELEDDGEEGSDDATLSRVATLRMYDDSRSIASTDKRSLRASRTSTQGQHPIRPTRTEPDEAIYEQVENGGSESTSIEKASDMV